MARRRVNKRFLTALFLLVAGGTVAILIAQNLLIKDHADRWVTMGAQAMQDEKWADAATDFNRAGQLDPNDPEIQMKLAAALVKMAALDPEKVLSARAAYERALEINPRFMPAIKDLLALYQNFAVMNPTASIYSEMITYARRGREIDPNDKQMAAVEDLLIAQKWMAGFETSQDEIVNAMKDMQDRLKADPGNSQLAVTVAQVWVRQAQDLSRQNASPDQPREVTDKFDNSRKLFTDELDPKIGEQDKNAAMHFRYAQVLMYLAGNDRAHTGNPKADADEAWNQIGQAQALATDKDRDYLDINRFAADLSERRGDHEGAVKICRAMPKNLQTQLDLAKYLGENRETRPEAESILQSELDSLKNSQSNQVTGVRITLLQVLTDMQVTDFADPKTDPLAKQSLHDTIQASLGKLDAAMGSRFSLDIKKVEARFLYLSHDWTAAINALTSMITADSNAAKDYMCLSMLAQAYEKTHQTGEAYNTYGRMIQLWPRDLSPRFAHAKLQETINPGQAQVEIDELEKLGPKDDQFATEIKALRMGLVVTDPEHPSEDAIANFKAYPETTGSDMIFKAKAAFFLHQYDDAVRLFNNLIDLKDPNARQDYYLLAQTYSRMGNKSAALDAATRGLKVYSDDTNLKQLISALNGEGASSRQAIREEAATQLSDPVTRETRLAQLAGERGDLAEQESHLVAAEAAANGDARTQVWDAMFSFYLANNQVAKAADLVPKLVTTNADSADGKLYQLKLSEAQGDYVHALDLAKSLARDRPDFASTYVALGDVLLGQNHVDEATSDYEVAIQKQANSLEAYQGLIRCAYQQGKVPDALRYIQEGLKKRPGDSALRNLLIAHHLNYGDPADAISVLSDELRDDPNSPKLQSVMIDVLLRIAAARKVSDPQTAAQALQEALKRSIDGVSRWPDDDKFYVSLSDTYQRLNRPQDAEKALLALAARDQWKDSPYPLARLSQFYEDNQQPDKAEAELRTAMDISKNRLDVEMDYGRLLAKHKKYDDCLALLNSANHDAPEIRDMRIRILWGAGRADQAEVEFNSDIKGNPPDEVELRSAWGRLLMDGGKYSAALEQAGKVLTLNPNNLEAYFTRGYSTLHIQPPDVTSAIADLVKYVQSPNGLARTRARVELAQAYLGLNRTSEAESQLAIAMRADPSNIVARMRMVELLSQGTEPRYLQALSLLRQVDSVEPYKSNADVFRNEAILYHDMKDLNSALACCQKALQLRPTDPQAGDIYLTVLLEANHYQDVIDTTTVLPDVSKNSWWALSKRAQAEKALGNQAAALADAQKALATTIAAHDSDATYQAALAISKSLGLDQAIAILTPHADEDLTVRLTLAEFYHSNGNDVSAVSIADMAMAGLSKLAHDDQVKVLSIAAQIYQSAKPQPLVDKAFSAYQQWVNLEPNNVAALNNIAWMLMEDYSPPRVADATQYMKRAIDLLPPNAAMDVSIEDTQGWLQILSGQAASGVDLLNKVIEARPSPETYLHIAQGYVQIQIPRAAGEDAKLGLNLINKQDPKDQDQALKAKLQDLITQSDQLQKANQASKAQ